MYDLHIQCRKICTSGTPLCDGISGILITGLRPFLLCPLVKLPNTGPVRTAKPRYTSLRIVSGCPFESATNHLGNLAIDPLSVETSTVAIASAMRADTSTSALSAKGTTPYLLAHSGSAIDDFSPHSRHQLILECDMAFHHTSCKFAPAQSTPL